MADFTRRFGRNRDGGAQDAGTRDEGAVATRERDRELDGAGTNRDGNTATRDRTVVDRDARVRQRDEYGGFNWGAAFFGWLVAIGIGVLVTAVIAAAGTAIGLTKVSASAGDATKNAGTIGVVGGVLLIAISMIAYYAGGYVAGRMSRFDGARQGLGVWVFGLIVTLAVAGAGAVFGDKYNVFEQLNLPRIPVSTSDLTTGGIIALAAILLGTLFAAMAGGKVGERYHRKVDRVAYDV
ncbi:MAG: hypothetical protein QOE08_9 [Thermoleophilaceae bacterium]|jgi:hypothetical protein|nr:hypothetical protein [Thermoleophilaceae bacterium]